MASMVILNLSPNEIYRIVLTARKVELQTAINGVRSTLLDNASLEVRVHVIVAIANALRKGLLLGLAAGALAVALSFFMEREKIASKALPKQKETRGKCNNGNENGKERGSTGKGDESLAYGFDEGGSVKIHCQ